MVSDMSEKEITHKENFDKLLKKKDRIERLMGKLNSRIKKLRWVSPCGALDEKHLNNLIDAIKNFYEFSHYTVAFLNGGVSIVEKIKPEIDSLREVSNLEIATPDMVNQFILVLTHFTDVLDAVLETFEPKLYKEIKSKFGESWHLYIDMKPYYNMLRVAKAKEPYHASDINNIINYFIALIDKFLDRVYFLSLEMYNIVL